MSVQEERFDARFKVFRGLVKAHIEEEGEILAQAEESSIDWETLSAQVLRRKEQLLAKAGAPAKNGRAKGRKKA